VAQKLEVAIDARKSEAGAEEVEGAFDTMVKAASGAADDMSRSGKKIDDSLDDNVDHSKRAADGIDFFKGAFVFTAAIAGTVALAASIQATVTDIDNMGKSADKAGVSLDFFQKLEFAASQSGIEIASVEGSLKDLQIRMGQAAGGSKPMIDAFEAAGVSIRDANGDMRRLEDVFPDVLDGIAKLGGGAESAALGVQLMGESFTQNAVLFRDGSETFKDLGQKAAELGIIMSEDTFKAAADLNDEMDVLTRIVKVGFAGALTSLAPILIDTIKFISNMTVGISAASTALLEFIGIGAKPKMEELATGADLAEQRFINLTLSIARAKKAILDLDGKNPEAEAVIKARIDGMVKLQQGIDLNRDNQSEADKEAAQATANALRWAEVLEAKEDKLFQKQLDNIAVRRKAEEDMLIAQIGIGTETDADFGPDITSTQDRLRTETDALAQSLLTREELQIQSLTRQQEAVQAAIDERVISAERGEELMTRIDERETMKRATILAGSVAQGIGGFVQLAQAFSDKNGEMTDLAKGLASTQVIINTAVGIMKSYADLGPIAGSFAAVGVAAAGAAQLAVIHGAGGGGGSISGTSAGLSTPQQPAFESSANIVREERGKQEINLYISGVAPEEYVESTLGPMLGNIINDNDFVLFNQDSRQAKELGG